MSFLTAMIYDRFMGNLEDACLTEWRSELLAPLKGDVLEVGAGTGVNLHLYPKSLDQLILSEPDTSMRKQLIRKLKGSRREFIQVSGDSAEQINVTDNSFDYVVMMLVGCSVFNQIQVYEELKRVLKPGGQLVFMEHVGAEVGTSRRRWQNRITPIWKRVAGNCHLNRDTEQTIRDAGFQITQVKRESMRKAASVVRPTIRGYARVASDHL